MDYCVRPSEAQQSGFIMPVKVMMDINETLDGLRVGMTRLLRATCENWQGAHLTWSNIPDDIDERCRERPDSSFCPPNSSIQTFRQRVSVHPTWGHCGNLETGAVVIDRPPPSGNDDDAGGGMTAAQAQQSKRLASLPAELGGRGHLVSKLAVVLIV